MVGKNKTESQKAKQNTLSEQESMKRNFKAETSQHSLVRSVTPDEDIPLDYVESEESFPGNSARKKLKTECEIEDMSPCEKVVIDQDDVGEEELQSPDYDEEVMDENLELRSLNDDHSPSADLEDGEDVSLSVDDQHSSLNRAEAISDEDDNDLFVEKEGKEERRPRTPLSPCPDNASQNDEFELSEADRLTGRRKRRGKRTGQIQSRISRIENADANGRVSDIPEAYRRQFRRRARGGRRVRAALMRQEAALRRTATDARILVNRRNRILRLREAQNRRLAMENASREDSLRFSSFSHRDMPESSRRIRENPINESARRVPAGRWVPPRREDPNVIRRNPSYYPSNEDSRLPPFPRNRIRSPFSANHTAIGRNRSSPPYIAPSSSRHTPAGRRTSVIRSHRSRSPRDRNSYRAPPVRSRTPPSLRYSDRRREPANYDARFSQRYRSPPLVSRYPGPRHHDLSPPPRNGRNFGEHSRTPLPPIKKRWRCPPREPSPT